jgi:hypothetical protein
LGSIEPEFVDFLQYKVIFTSNELEVWGSAGSMTLQSAVFGRSQPVSYGSPLVPGTRLTLSNALAAAAAPVPTKGSPPASSKRCATIKNQVDVT